MKGASVVIGYAKRGMEDYKDWSRYNQTGIDLKAQDGKGNTIEVYVRRDYGYRIVLNGKDIAEG